MKQPCCHDGCKNALPDDEQKIPPGWTIARVEEYRDTTINVYFVYACPDHKLVTASKQTSLFDGGETSNQPEASSA
jgi:hypothetical protein